MVLKLLDQGAEMRPKDQNGETALFKAAQNGQAEVMNVLLKYTNHGSHRRFRHEIIDCTVAPYEGAAFSLQHMTPLMIATSLGHVNIVRQLLSAKARPDHVEPLDEAPLTALEMAAKSGNVQLVKLLMAYGATRVAQATSIAEAHALSQVARARTYRIARLIARLIARPLARPLACLIARLIARPLACILACLIALPTHLPLLTCPYSLAYSLAYSLITQSSGRSDAQQAPLVARRGCSDCPARHEAAPHADLFQGQLHARHLLPRDVDGSHAQDARVGQAEPVLWPADAAKARRS